MYETSSFDDTEEIQSLDISLKQIPFLSIESKLSVNALYKMLLKNPKLINMTDEKKETFLSYAIKRNNEQIIDFIMKSPLLDLSYQDKNGNTYLHISVIQQNVDLIERLIKKNISINTQNKDGNTVLHLAYYINNIEIINLLINNHIDTNIKNNQGLIAKEVIPTNDIDKIAGYEVNMNFDINFDEELKYHDSIKELEKNINKNENEIDKNKENQNKSIEIQKKDSLTKNNTINNKKSNKKNKINNKKIVNIKNNIINENEKNNKNLNVKSLFNNKNNKNINKNDNNNKKNKNKITNNKENNEEEELNEDYKDLKNLPFRGARKISNIDIIYNENDRFVRRESEFYPFYAELLNARRESNISPTFKNDHLSKIIENNNASEGNSNNEIRLTNNEINNNTTSEENSNNEIAISNNETKNNNISEGNSNEIIITNHYIKNNNISLLNNTNKNNSTSLLNNSNNKNNNYSILNLKKNNSINNSDNNITMMQNIMINCTNKSLLDFLMSIKLQKYYNNMNNNGLGDIDKIIENAKKGIYLTDNDLKKVGIIKAGDIAKILIRIQENANIFEFAVPKNVYYIRFNFEKIETDINILKLYEWLVNIKLEEYLKNFLNNGYFSIDLLFVQLLSNNPLTDDILKNDLGIDKLGYRARILNKLKEECPNYSNKLRESIVTYHSIENTKICNECKIC